MKDETPTSPHRRPTEELGMSEFVKYRLHELKSAIDDAADQNREILARLSDLSGDLKVGNEKFHQHEAQIRELHSHKNKALWGLITGLLGLIASMISYIVHGGKGP